jgi:ferredoxin
MVHPPMRLEASAFDALLEALRAEGFAPIGPRERDGVIVYDAIDRAADLPQGVSDEQAPGRYRLTRPGHRAFFGFAAPAQSWKRELLPPSRRQWTARRREDGALDFAEEPRDAERRAFVGVRPCELAAISVQDRVLAGGAFHDADYASRRAHVAIVALQCTTPGGTCFCGSMGTGPRVAQGFDLSLTEVEGAEDHHFLVASGSSLGDRVLARLPVRPATAGEVAAGDERLARAERHMGRTLQTEGLPALLARSHEAPHWAAVADRCLTCTNCTMVCPTCFCTTVDDVPSLDGDRAERWRRWDSCFTLDFSYLHGGAVRASAAARYRQWLTHKLGSWWTQFGSSGCVGCGRCITWCPVGIDLTAEVAALQSHDAAACAARTLPSEEETWTA